MANAKTKNKPVVMCVDDDKDFLDSMRIILEDNGYTAVTASSGEEGLKKYKTGRPDFVLVDMMMEEVDSGINFVKELRLLGPTPQIIMLSSVGDNLNSNTDYSQLGLSGVLQKPVNPDTLLRTLKAKLATK